MKIKFTHQIILAISALFLCKISLAETCPSVRALKAHALSGWIAYDSDDSNPLSPNQEAKFKKSVQQFALAEWTSKEHHRGTIHCYYLDQTGSDLNAYLSKDNFMPMNADHYWYKVSGSMQCAAGKERCGFKKYA